MESLVCNLCGSDRIQEVVRKNGFPIVQCKGCSLLFAVEKEPKRREEIFSAEYYNKYYPKFQLIERYADTIDGERDRQILRRLRAFGVHGTLLDVGAGLGLFLDLARHEGWTAVGVEPSPYACCFAKERFSVEMKQGTLHSAGFPKASFDAVVSQHVLPAVHDPGAHLREIHRILRAGGLFVLTVPVPASSLARRICGTALINPPHELFSFSWRTAERYLEVNGFADILTREMNFSVGQFIDVAKWWLPDATQRNESYMARARPLLKGGALRALHRLLKPVINKMAITTKIGDEVTIFARRSAQAALSGSVATE